jgi:methyltransferase-like protein/predicted O-methyltransferase YrrM
MQTVYDEFPYPGAAFAQTHPNRLATVATLFGMTPASVKTCRVLELGSGDGGNLVPMAFSLPNGHFTGVDLAGSAVAQAQELINQLGLTNIRVEQRDLMDLGADFGEYDYVIAHGLYSWVPPPVREKILEICRSHLAPNGVAYISYNAYPGGHLRDAIREMVRFHTRHIGSPREQVRQARELLEFLIQAHPEEDPYGVFLRSELQSILKRSPAAFYHDELGEHNHRFYFHEFLADASRHGLEYLSEARLSSMQIGAYPPEVTDRIRALAQGDDLAREQYADFLKLNTFRQTLLCHAELRLERRLDVAQVLKMSASADVQPVSPHPDLHSTAAEEFQFQTSGKITSNHPITKAALLHLGRIWPKALPVSELLQITRALSGRDRAPDGAPAAEDSAWLLETILKLYAVKFMELHVYVPSFAAEVSERPVASPLAQAQIRRGVFVSNLACGSTEIQDETVRQLVLLLDGTRNRDQLLTDLRARVSSVEITAEQLEMNLSRLARFALLTA